MIEKYYYLRDHNNHAPLVSVCLMKNEAGVARGVAICSKNDNPCRRDGRWIASTRAKAALTFTDEADPIQTTRALVQLYRCGGEGAAFNYLKSEFNPILTEFEKRLLA